MFHIELRQFPHNACAFNLTEVEVGEIVEPWSRDEWIEVGERKWSPHQARLTVLEGPRLETEDLAMGRGWRNAQHKSQDVTESVIAQALASSATASPSGAVAAGTAATVVESSAGGTVPTPTGNGVPSGDRASGALETELHPLLGPDPSALLQAWRLAAQRRPELSPSQSLALAESTLSALDAPSS